MSQYTTVDNAVLPQLAKIHGMAISVYVALKSFSDRDGTCFPSLDAVARLSGTSVPTVQRVVRDMITRRLVSKVQRNAGSGRLANLYQFPMVPQTNGVRAQWSDRPSPMVPQTMPNGLTDQGTNSTELTPLNKSPLSPPKGKLAAKKQKWCPETIDLPESLGEVFRPTWIEWCRWRREEKGKQITPTAAKRQLAKLASWGLAAAQTSVDNSITNEWTGLFEPRGPTREHGQSRSVQDDLDKLPDLETKGRTNERRI